VYVPSFVEKYPKIKYALFDRPPGGKGPFVIAASAAIKFTKF
jgi:hypothetical protein